LRVKKIPTARELAGFYRRPWSWRAALGFSLLGTCWSYLLDVPAIVSMFVLPGGFWIC
jgi:hypothetical protein